MDQPKNVEPELTSEVIVDRAKVKRQLAIMLGRERGRASHAKAQVKRARSRQDRNRLKAHRKRMKK